MNAITILASDGPLTMTSREIAELTGKEHDNVRRDIKNLAESLSLSFEEKPEPSDGGRPAKVYVLAKRETLILVSGYNVTMRAKIIDRWQELEAQVADPMRVLSDPAAMRGLLLGYTEKVLALEGRVQELAPKAAALDMISAGEEDLTMTQAAKVLDVKVNTLTNWLSANGWVYRQNGSWVAYQQHIANGRLRYKEAHYTDANTGQACLRPYCHITPKGLAKLAVVLHPVAA